MASKSWAPWWSSPAQQGHVNSAVGDITLCWWLQEITSDNNNSRYQTQHVPHYVSPQILSTLFLERVKQKSQQKRPPAEWPEQLQVWHRACEQRKPQVSLPGRTERKDGPALALPSPGKLPICSGWCLSSTQPRRWVSNTDKKSCCRQKQKLSSMWRCQAIRHNSLWLVQDCHECSFPSSTTPLA